MIVVSTTNGGSSFINVCIQFCIPFFIQHCIQGNK